MLKIYLFGTPRIFQDNQPISINRRLARTILFYLAGHGKPVSRTKLADLFWPDSSEDESRTNLRDQLSRLRQSLPDPDMLKTQNEIVSLDFENVFVDYLEFTEQLGTISGTGLRLPVKERITLAQYQTMKSLVSLWDEQDFFCGYDLGYSDELEHWRTQIASGVNSQIVAVLDRLAEYDQSNGNFENAVHWLSLAANVDTYNDELHARIIKNYLLSGMQSQARQYFERIKQFWLDEFSGELPESLISLESQVYATAPGLLAKLKNRWPVKFSTQVPFVGQTEILESLLHAWRTGGSVLILGEAGAGKTRLVQETFQRITPMPRLMLGACQPLETNLPFTPWVSLLRHSVHPQEWRSLDIVWAQPLVLLLPELATLRDDVSPALSVRPDISRSVLIDAISQILTLLVREGPLFVFIDDVQWADDASLAVISHLLQNQFFGPGRGLLVMASRLEERNPLLDTLLVTTTSQRIRQVQIPALELTEISEIADSMLGLMLPDIFIERLDRDTGGNPLFLLEILQSLLDKGIPDDLAQMENLPLPQSVHELIQRRLQKVYPDAREVLSTAALLGSQFALDLIENATHFIPEVTARAIMELENARLLQPIPAETPTYGFPHEKIRESLLVEISPARKRFYHQNIARALEKFLGQQIAPQAATLAYHYEQAGNFSKAFEYWTMAGQHAHRLASFHESLAAFGRAERIIARAPGLTEQDLYNLYSIWNDALFQSDQPQALKRVNQALLTLGEERQSPLLIGTALSGMSDAYMAENDFEAALKSVQDGLEYVRLSGNSYEMVRTLDRIGVYHYMLGQLPESQPYFQQSLEISKNSIDSLMVFQRCSTHYQLAITAALSGNPLQGLDYAKKTLEDAVRSYHPYGQVLAYSVMGLAHYTIGDYEEGRRACQLGMSFEHIQAWRMMGYISSYYGMNAVEMGNFGEAWQYGQKAIEIGRRHGHGEVAALGHKAIGDIYLRLGAYPLALKSYQQGIHAAGDHFVALENMHRYGYLLYKQGQTALGKEYLQQALDLSAQSGLWSIHFLGIINQLEILASENKLDEFEQLAAWFSQQSIERLGKDMTQFSKKRAQLFVAIENKAFEKALTLALECLPWYQEKNMLWRELECLKIIRQAKNGLSLNDSLEAERMAHLVRVLQDKLGAAPIAEYWENFKAQILQT